MSLEINKIYNMDCLEGMRQMDDESVDLVVTDPPYGQNYYSGHYKYGNPHQRIYGDDKYPSHLIPEYKRIARKAVLCFCRWDNLREVEKPTSFIVWAKNNWSAGDLNHAYGRQWEGILFYPCDQHAFIHRPSDVIDHRRMPPTEIKHPTQKPVGLIELLIIQNSNEGDLILDPFMGSGTTAIACIRTNRNYIGFEIDKGYFEIAEKRMANEMKQTKLELAFA